MLTNWTPGDFPTKIPKEAMFTVLVIWIKVPVAV